MSFFKLVRPSFLPKHLSIDNEELRFVGEFANPDRHHWDRFESEVWPDLMGEVIRSIQVRHHREVNGLRQYIETLRSSVSYHVGKALVVAAKEPWTLWRLPAKLWCMYRSTNSQSSPQNTFPKVEVPSQGADSPVVAAILDTSSEYCLRYEADLVPLTPKSWQEELERSQPTFLLVESAWAGNNGKWRGMIANYQELNPLGDLLRYCRKHKISTVFWNKEDPLNFDLFINAAKEFDIVFTSDANSIPRYKEMCGHGRIYALAFAAQPRLHNPCKEPFWPRHAVCFPRSCMKESLSFLLDPALQFGLHIFDDHLNRSDLGPDSPPFPDGYQSAVQGFLDEEKMLAIYRCYKVVLNANSVTKSPTMFSRCVFESLACGTPVVSTESIGMRQMLGDHINITGCTKETADHLGALLSDEERRIREGHLAYRYVHEHHTYKHRMDEMLSQVGLKPQKPTRSSVSVITATYRPKNVTRALETFAKQSYQEKELLLVLNNALFDIDVIRVQAQKLPQCAYSPS